MNVKNSILKSAQAARKNSYKELLTLLFSAHAGHIGSCLSCLDILLVTWYEIMKSTDKFILSKGHAAPALYVVLRDLGLITKKDYQSFHANGTTLPAHTPNNFRDIIPFHTGSLGHGLSLSTGLAFGYAMQDLKSKTPRVFCLMSDGECNEGQVWEAAQFASHFKLRNLIVMIDKNKWQALGKTKDVLGDSAAPKKWKAFGFDVFTCDGHDIKSLKKAFKEVDKRQNDKPAVIICDTVKGHGISFMANKLESHYQVIDETQYKQAIKEFDKLK